ncbi:MAG: diguanylate cyclase domain-containing protein [Cyanophyceae cyanobacterium]
MNRYLTEPFANIGHLLIVDDNPVNLSVLSKALKNAGLKVRVAVDGESAIEQIQEDPPELILLDVQMPGIDGFETCSRLKALAVTREVPIIFMTALSDGENKVKGLSLGAVDYITKPFYQEEVIARVKVHLKLRLLTQKVVEQAAELEQANQELQRLAIIDSLTQVANRRRFDQCLQQEWRRMLRKQMSVSLIMCDIDYFKQYNDCYGHLAGDVCLKRVAQAIGGVLRRPADLLARYGGEEFGIVLPETEPAGAIRIAKLIQRQIQQLKIPHERTAYQYVTLSMGISSQIPAPQTEVESLVAAADRLLYLAKEQGRNRYCIDTVTNTTKCDPVAVA